MADSPNTKKWYIALVANNTELATQKWLIARGTDYPVEGEAEYFVPTLAVETISRGKARQKEMVAIPSFLFVRTTNKVRYNLSRVPNIKRWVMSSCTDKEGRRLFATVPDDAMTEFINFIRSTNGHYEIASIGQKLGRPIRFIGGPLKGFEGIIEEQNGRYIFKKSFDSEFLPTITTVVTKDTVGRFAEPI